MKNYLPLILVGCMAALFAMGQGTSTTGGGGGSNPQTPISITGAGGVAVSKSGNNYTISGTGAVAAAVDVFSKSNNYFFGQNTFTNTLTLDGPVTGTGSIAVDLFATQPTKVLYVDSGRSGYTPDGSELKPYTTIQAAIDALAALAPATYYAIDIADGIYTENLVLESAGLKYVKLQGHGYVSVNPASGNALQSAASNDNLVALYVDNISFAKPVVLTGANGAASFADVMLSNVSFTGTSSLTGTCLNNLSMRNVYSERPIAFSNVVWSYIESGQLQGTFSATMNSTTDLPSGGSAGTVLANGVFQSGTCSYTIGGTATYTVAPNGCRWGSGAVTVPVGVSILAYNSFVRGTHTNNGSITLRNSNVEGYVAGSGSLTITGQPASQVSNDSTVSGTSVKDALDTLLGLTNGFEKLDGSLPWTADHNAGGYSLTNLSPSTLKFNNGTVALNSGLGLSDLASPATARTNLSLVPGVNVQTYNANLDGFATLNGGSLTNLQSTALIGNISVNNLNSGTGASGSTFWRGDGTWAAAGGGGGGDAFTASNNTFTATNAFSDLLILNGPITGTYGGAIALSTNSYTWTQPQLFSGVTNTFIGTNYFFGKTTFERWWNGSEDEYARAWAFGQRGAATFWQDNADQNEFRWRNTNAAHASKYVRMYIRTDQNNANLTAVSDLGFKIGSQTGDLDFQSSSFVRLTTPTKVGPAAGALSGTAFSSIQSAPASLAFTNALAFGQCETNTIKIYEYASGISPTNFLVWANYPMHLPMDSVWSAFGSTNGDVHIRRQCLTTPVEPITNLFRAGYIYFP